MAETKCAVCGDTIGDVEIAHDNVCFDDDWEIVRSEDGEALTDPRWPEDAMFHSDCCVLCQEAEDG